MRIRSMHRLAALVPLLCLAAGIASVAAPFSPGSSTLPDEQRSLAGIRQVHLRISEIPLDLETIGLTAERIRTQCKKKLADAGIELLDESQAPFLSLTIMGGIEPDAPEAIGFVLLMELEQAVYIERLRQTLEVPTYTKMFMVIETVERAPKLAKLAVNQLISRFVTFTGAASRSTDLPAAAP
ncbi:MAG: hypothetical protein CMJ18_21925 [Phycisphaeraceae bacterium]|nr:hypothetical protein [Phycisphaeraceae bacterium]